MENDSATAIKAGADGVGAVNDRLDWSGSAERSAN